jgi:hypothetical protein
VLFSPEEEVAMDEERKVDESAELLRASAFLARCGSFGYIETRSGMKMSDKKPLFAFGLPGARLGRTNIAPRQMQFLTGSAPQTEIDVTCSKQTVKKFLTGARTHIRETPICAKISAQISAKLSAQMSQTR